MIREPITSMHLFCDERESITTITKRERGLPLQAFRRSIISAGWKIKKESLYGFGPLLAILAATPFRYTRAAMCLDDFMCNIFRFNYSYNTKSIWGKFRPTAAAWVLDK